MRNNGIYSYDFERVQRSAARYVMNDYNYTISVTKMVDTLEWKTLQYRRLNSSLLLFYNIRAQTVAADQRYLIPLWNLSYLIPQSRTQYFADFYFPRIIRLWNSLPTSVKASPAILFWQSGWWRSTCNYSILSYFSSSILSFYLLSLTLLFLTSLTAPTSHNRKSIVGSYRCRCTCRIVDTV